MAVSLETDASLDKVAQEIALAILGPNKAWKANNDTLQRATKAFRRESAFAEDPPRYDREILNEPHMQVGLVHRRLASAPHENLSAATGCEVRLSVINLAALAKV